MSALFTPIPYGQSGSGEVFYPVGAATFNGTTTYLSRAVNELSNGSGGTFSCWLNLVGGNSTTMVIFDSLIFSVGTNSIIISRSASNKLNITISYNISFTQYSFQFQTVNSYTSGGGWIQLLVSWDANHGAGGKIGLIYISDISDSTIISDTGIALASLNNTQHFIGSANGSSLLNASLSELYYSTHFTDLTILANRRKFITASKRPAFLGFNGSLPSGSQPSIYLRGTGTGFNIESGSLPNYTTVGTLTTSTTTPSAP